MIFKVPKYAIIKEPEQSALYFLIDQGFIYSSLVIAQTHPGKARNERGLKPI
ncbi:hypothetical protein [Oscillatoria sp. HE19RPO]|uniref:hypothetical protein n=1 Tax=Oscillatoria sp. HE19RPO TaxID=2954806 RepID=UPI0020C5988F|nr:hypothetical protein [Oscillatoria sp. HE19RPO]